jgi:hypothetical protein
MHAISVRKVLYSAASNRLRKDQKKKFKETHNRHPWEVNLEDVSKYN